MHVAGRKGQESLAAATSKTSVPKTSKNIFYTDKIFMTATKTRAAVVRIQTKVATVAIMMTSILETMVKSEVEAERNSG